MMDITVVGMRIFDLGENLLWSAVAILGFALLFRVPFRVLYLCVLAGALGYGTRSIILENNGNVILASLVGATIVGFLGYFLAQKYRMPTPVFTVPAIIPFIPGALAFQSMVAVIRALEMGKSGAEAMFISAAFDALTVALILFSLGIGISAPILLFRRHRPVV